MEINAILEQFGLTPPFTTEKAPTGLIHKTYFVRATEGEFVAQQLHEVVRTETCEDAKVVTDFARERGVTVPEFLVTAAGKPWVQHEGALWRVMKRLGGESYDTVDSSNKAYNAARLIGQFHTALKGSNYQCRGSIPHFHDTPYIFDQFKKVVEIHRASEKYQKVSEDVEYLIEQIQQEFLPQGLPRQIVHGDLKISNFLFSGNDALGLLDFDTCMNHSPLVDIGDALRSWCNTAGEDTPDAAFDATVYDAALQGYLETGSPSTAERELIPQAFRLLTIELAMRFLKDYFEDSYFGWNEKQFGSRAEHNLVRARGQLSLYKQIAGL